MTSKADVLIVTVTKVESSTVMQVFSQATDYKAAPRSIKDRVYFDLGIVNSARVFLTQSEMGSGGLGASLLAVSKGIDALSPAAVIMVGIAFGINEQKQAIGDILVTEQLRLYDLQRVGTQDGQLRINLRGDKPHASPWLINHFKSADLLWQGAKVRFGVVLTGEKLVDNVDFRDQLHNLEPEAIGGEMEGAGLYVACQDSKVDWILVKAICDWADGNKAQDKNVRQQTAAQNAAEFVLESLQFVSIDWQQRRGQVAQNVQSININSPVPVSSQSDFATRSQTTGIDYKELSDLLRDKKWREADEKTVELMLIVAKREEEGFLGLEAIENLPVEDLKIIDRLWVNYSEGRYGFSVQKKIWQEREDSKDWKIFGYHVGWYKNGGWLNYSHMISQLDKLPPGVLPRGGVIARRGLWLGGVALECAELFFSRIPSLDYRRDLGLSQELNLKSRTARDPTSLLSSSTDAKVASDPINPLPPDNSQVDIATRSQTTGIDYKELSDLLRDKKWREADKKTAELMLKVANREKEGWLDVKAIKKFPIEDLQIIDRLWINYSDGLYGFSVQKKIWEECGSQKHGYGWKKFGDRVGWRNNGEWLDPVDIIPQPQKSPYSFPLGLFVEMEGGNWCSSLLFHPNLQPSSSTGVQVASDRIDPPASANSQSDIATSSQTSGTDYKELGDLLRNKKWREANEMTAELMLKVAIKQDESCLNEKALKNFPTEDLQIIDHLWVKYSDGCSGFSVQKKIWEECGSPREYSGDWEKFGDRVGWRKEGQWLTYSDRIFQPEISPNSLPWTVDICGGVLMVYRCYSLFSHPGLNHSIEQELSQQLNLKLRHTPPVISPPAPESLHPPQTPAVSQPAITTKSQTTGTDYTELSNLLRDKQWENADKKTAELILEVAKREKRGYLDVEDIEKFPIEDLQIIDRLWVKYSKGKYGFSVQKKVWEKCGSPKRYGEEWKRFGDLVGWRRGDDWLSYHELVSNPKKYTLPARCLAPWSFATYGWYDTAGFFEHSKDNCGGWSCFSSFASRL